MKKIIFYTIIGITALIALLVVMRKSETASVVQPLPEVGQEEAQSGEVVEEGSVEESISKELQGIDFGDLEKEFESINQDLQSL